MRRSSFPHIVERCVGQLQSSTVQALFLIIQQSLYMYMKESETPLHLRTWVLKGVRMGQDVYSAPLPQEKE